MVNNFFNNMNNRNRKVNLMRMLIARSKRAVCGATEREVIVPTSQVPAAIAAIRRSGKIFVGTGPAGAGRTKIWWSSTALL